MDMRTTAKLFIVALFSVFLMAGCATTGEGDLTAAEQAIADAKASNAEAKSMGYEWRDTSKVIAQAEAALAAGNDDEAIRLANKAQAQAEAAIAQGRAENAKFADSMSDSDRAAFASSMGLVDNYTVIRGDNLWDISAKDSVYSNPYQWPLIYKANRGQIKDADLIYPGQNFDIDRTASSSDIGAAVRHARSRGAWSVGNVEQSDLNYLDR